MQESNPDRKRNDREVASACVIGLIASLFAVLAFRMKIGTFLDPGPGLYPFMLATLLFSLAMVRAVLYLREEPTTGDCPPERKFQWANLCKVLAALALYGALLEFVGFLVSNLAFLIFLFIAVGRYGWRFSVSVSVAAAVLAQFTFVYLLRLELPDGVLSQLWKS